VRIPSSYFVRAFQSQGLADFPSFGVVSKNSCFSYAQAFSGCRKLNCVEAPILFIRSIVVWLRYCTCGYPPLLHLFCQQKARAFVKPGVYPGFYKSRRFEWKSMKSRELLLKTSNTKEIRQRGLAPALQARKKLVLARAFSSTVQSQGNNLFKSCAPDSNDTILTQVFDSWMSCGCEFEFWRQLLMNYTAVAGQLIKVYSVFYL
jgi:hypothetical protein